MTASLATAISAIRDNRREEGRKLLNLLIQQNPNDEGAWLWMSEVVENNEHRAKCLQHVLMINPNNSLARHGLTRLGHDVPDLSKQAAKTKPVTPQLVHAVETAHVHTQSEPEQPASKPLDPKEITKEMPFTPLREPFSDEAASEAVNGSHAHATQRLTVQPPQRKSDTKQRLRILSLALQEKMGRTHDSQPSLPSLVKEADNSITVHENTGDDKRTKDTKEIPAAIAAPSKPEEVTPPAVPLPDFEHALTQTEQRNGSAPSQPIPVVASSPVYVSPSQVTRPVTQQAYHPSQMISQPQPANGGAMIIQLTRPSQPYQLPHAQTIGMPTSTPYQSEPVPVIHTNTTIGMPYQPQPVMTGHTQATLGMPVPQQAPMPNSHDTASMTPAQMPPNPSGPSDQALIAAWQNGTYQAHQYAPQIEVYDEQEEEDEVNLIAVFVFGFFSITALGGLGVLTIIGVTAGF